jgi:predicted acylesterase/phospholipase RssA
MVTASSIPLEGVPVPTTAKQTSLLETVREQGSVRVIVGLDVSFQPEGNLPNEQAVQAQRQAIAAAQDRLLQRMAPFAISNVSRYEFIPFVAMTVDEPALRDLIANPEVHSIGADTPIGPAAPGTVPMPPKP